jgi:membrane fusion protein (multidrug efflux system)
MTTSTLAGTTLGGPPTSPPADTTKNTGRNTRRNTRRNGLALLAIVVAVGAIWYGAHWYSEGRFLQETDDAYVGGNITVISAKVPGYIDHVTVNDNQAVHAGDILARLDDRDYRAALAKAEGAVSAQQALLNNLDATRELQRAVIAQARAGFTASRAESNRAHDDQVRYMNLSAKAAVSLQSAQNADATYKQALANDQKTAAGLLASARELDVISARKQQAQAALAQAIADRDMAKLNLEHTILRAPIDGTIGNRRARDGAYAAAGSQLLSVVPAHGLWVDANFKESQLARFRPGMRATIEADVVPGRVFHGTVASLAPATGAQFSVLPPENATGNFTKIVQRVPVRILLDDADATLGTLRPGLSVLAEIDVRADHP